MRWRRCALTATASTPSSRTANPNSPVAEQNLSRDTCAPCHEGVRLSQEFGVPGEPRHQLLRQLSRAGSGGRIAWWRRIARAATACTTFCHRAIRAQPSIPRTLEATCGKCHKGVTQKFTLTKVHLQRTASTPKDIDSVAVRWVRLDLHPLILLVIGAMFLHNAIIWRSKAVARRTCRIR